MKRTTNTNNTPPAKQPKDRVQPGTFLDAKIYQKAKIQAMTEQINVGELIDRAILIYLAMPPEARIHYTNQTEATK
jgi:hypothetical protein